MPTPKKNKGLLLMTTGERIEIAGELTNKVLQKMVGGYFEILQTKDGEQMIVNNEGGITELPKNDTATKLSERGGSIYVVGDVVVIEKGFELE